MSSTGANQNNTNVNKNMIKDVKKLNIWASTFQKKVDV